MKLSLFSNDEQKQDLLGFSNPFNKNGVRYVEMEIGRPIFHYGDEPVFNATIHFDSGSTTGMHRIKSTDFPTLVKDVQNFLDNI